MIKDFLLDSLYGIGLLLYIFFILGCIGAVITIGAWLYEWNHVVGLIYTVTVIGSMLGQLGD